jgi:hypothetical protein
VDIYLDYYFKKELEKYPDLSDTPENKDKYRDYMLSKIGKIIDLYKLFRIYDIPSKAYDEIIDLEMEPIYEEFSEIFSHGNEINYYTEKAPLNL